MGFEPTTPGLKVRSRSSQPVPPRHAGASFVSENCHPRPVLTLFVPAFVAQLGDKMATNAKPESWAPSLPHHLMQPYRLLEALQGSLAFVGEGEALASRQLLDDIGDEYLPRLRVVADACGEVDGRPEEVMVFCKRLTGVEADVDT